MVFAMPEHRTVLVLSCLAISQLPTCWILFQAVHGPTYMHEVAPPGLYNAIGEDPKHMSEAATSDMPLNNCKGWGLQALILDVAAFHMHAASGGAAVSPLPGIAIPG